VAESSAPLATTGQATADLILLPHPSDVDAASALTGHLRKAGLRVVLAGAEPLDDNVFEGALAVAVLWGPGGKPAWEVEDLRESLDLFVRRRPSMHALRLPGSGDPPPLPSDWKCSGWIDLGPKLSSGCVTVIRSALACERPAAVRKVVALAALPGQAFTEPLTGIRFLWIPGSRFPMGGKAYDDEKPIHWVRISPFWFAETPVTNRQYAVFLEQKTGVREPDYWRDQRFSSPDQPVVGVSWEDAQGFCRWLSGESSQKIILPSEAQWEFAARGTDGREYPWGNEPPDVTRARFDVLQPAPVGSFPAGQGPFGTLDQAGNAWEWCRDAWDAKAYAQRAKTGGEPVDPVEGKDLTGEGVVRVLRGGGRWIVSPVRLRAACRNGSPAGYRNVEVGFRVAAAPASLDA